MSANAYLHIVCLVEERLYDIGYFGKVESCKKRKNYRT